MGLGGRGAAMIVNMVVLAVTSRLLTPVAFGEFAICQVVVDLGQAVSASFVSVSMLQRSRMRGREYRLALTVTLFLALSAGALLALLSPFLATWLTMPNLEPLLYAIVPILTFRILASFYTGALQRRVKVAAVIRAQSVSQILSPVLVTLPLAWAGFGAWSLAIGLGAATASELFLLMLNARVPLRLTLPTNAWYLFRGGWPSLTNRLLVFVADSSDRFVVGRAYGAHALGIYSRSANLVRLPINLVGLPLQNALLSWFSRYQDKEETVAATIRQMMAVQSFAFPISLAGLWLATPLIVLVMLGHQWREAVPVAQILFVGSLARLCTIPLESACMVMGLAWSSARRQIVATGVLLAGLLLAAKGGLVWVAVAVSASRFVYYLLCLKFGMKAFALHGADYLKSTLAGMLTSAIAAALAVLIAGFAPITGTARDIVVFATFALASLTIILAFPGKAGRPLSQLLRTRIAGLTGRLSSDA